MNPATATTEGTDAAAALGALDDARGRTLELVAGLSDADLHAVHSPLMSPLVWDLGHIAAFEDLWLVHRHGGESMLRGDLAEIYDAFETPRWERGDLPFLQRDEAIAYLGAVRERVRRTAERTGIGDGLLFEMVVQHEAQHNETMLQTLGLARLASYEPPGRREAQTTTPTEEHTGLELVEVPGGAFELGAPTDRFAYDNERPRRAVELPAFRIGRTPVTNASFLHFVEGGGYERREWWSDEAWSWKQENDIHRPAGWTGDGREWTLAGEAPLDPHKPVAHVSWFEADAFARSHGARLPTEVEWEKAATWNPETGETQEQPWGSAGAGPALANVGQQAYGVIPAGSLPAGAAPCGALGMIGDLWEWTSSRFGGYPGFTAHPYEEYSEVFFGGNYLVLRGGSWATGARVATPTFRNWDHPQRRQIFSGFRIAGDA